MNPAVHQETTALPRMVWSTKTEEVLGLCSRIHDLDEPSESVIRGGILGDVLDGKVWLRADALAQDSEPLWALQRCPRLPHRRFDLPTRSSGVFRPAIA